MSRPAFDKLGPDLQKVFDPTKAKTWGMVAKGLAPIPPSVLIPSLCYLLEDPDAQLSSSARQSLKTFPEKNLLPLLENELPEWVLESLGSVFVSNEKVLEAVLLNPGTPSTFFVEIAKTCSERLSTLIAENQERVIECPQIILSLESNQNHLKSSTDKLRQFLRLAGIPIPGDQSSVVEEKIELMDDEAFLSSAIEGFDDEQKAKSLLAASGNTLNEEQRQSLLQFIQKLNVGAKVKLAVKGNKEARSYLIRDTNSIVALSVLKSPRITDAEVAVYASMRNVPDDVIRTISVNSGWTRNYQVKLALCFHPKTPLQYSSSMIKFLNLRDLVKLSKDKNALGPLVKAAKQLLAVKRK